MRGTQREGRRETDGGRGTQGEGHRGESSTGKRIEYSDNGIANIRISIGFYALLSYLSCTFTCLNFTAVICGHYLVYIFLVGLIFPVKFIMLVGCILVNCRFLLYCYTFTLVFFPVSYFFFPMFFLLYVH